MSIQTTISMQNQVSSVLSSIVSSMDMVIASAYEVQNTTGSMIDTSSLEMAKRSMADASVGINQMTTAQEQLNTKVKESNGLFSGLKGKIIGAVGAYAGIKSVKAFVGLSDEMAQINARLDIMKSKGETVAGINQKIFETAQASRGSYLTMADSVAKLGMQAGDAFKNTDEIIKFTELLNKNFVLSGASAEGTKSAMYQLNQAMAMGVLRGEEFNAINENAPSIVKAIADKLNITKGEVKALAGEGKITADVVKSALFEAADATNKKFNEMPMTFEQIRQSIANKFVMGLQPALNKLNEFMNSSSFMAFADNIASSMGIVASIVGITVEALVNGFNIAAWAVETFKYPLLGLITILGIYYGAIAVGMAIEKAKAIVTGISTLATELWALATKQATVSQLGLNAAILASPLFWIPAILIGIIALIFMIIQWVNKAQGTTTSAVGVICGVLNVGIAFIKNLFIGLANAGITVVETIQNGFISFAEFLLNVFNNPVESIIKLFSDMANTVLGILKSIASAIDGVFGSNLAGAIGGWKDNITGFADKFKPDDYTTLERKQYDRIERVGYADAYNVGYKWGADKEKAIKNKFTSLTNPSKLADQNALASKLGDSIKDKDLKDKVGKIADSTNGIDKKLDKVDWENNNLDSLKGLMETRAINDLSKSVKLNVHNEFTGAISSDVDVDEVADRATRKIMHDLELATNAG